MSENKSHKTTVNRLLNKFKTEPQEEGADIQANNLVVEVETEKTIGDGIRQLQGYRKPVYIAGVNKEAVEQALTATEGTSIGVMDNQGNVIKKSTREK
jgi:sulfur carrier protein ThiS